MKKKLSILLSVIGWFAVITQYLLMLESSKYSIGETTIRFLSYFTFLTNILIVIYFSYHAIIGKQHHFKLFDKPGSLTALTVYITFVGLVYHLVLRHIWEPTGMQLIVTELLHSVIPLCVILFWFLYENKTDIKWRDILKWLIYPMIYGTFVLFRGNISEFYPYPFYDVPELGLQKVLFNGTILLIIILVLSILLFGVGKRIDKLKKPTANNV